jgi:hypothetical protein
MADALAPTMSLRDFEKDLAVTKDDSSWITAQAKRKGTSG